MKYDYLIVGAGISGLTAARIIAENNKRVIIVDKRSHIGGNCFDYKNEYGIIIQKYGPHIFHTNDKQVWDFLNKFTEFNNYEHRVIAKVKGIEVFLPINIETMERLYTREFNKESMSEFLKNMRIELKEIKNSRDFALSQIGEELYELFFKNYTKKQWGVYPENLGTEVLKRIPLRFNRDTRYFSDKYQGIPKNGYSYMFENMADNKNIEIVLNKDYRDIINDIKFDKMIYSAPLDSFFDYKFGRLEYRSLKFELKTFDFEYFQNSAVVNYPNDFDYTRITEFKRFYFQKTQKTTICYEYPQKEGEPYYPIPNNKNIELKNKYLKEANKLKSIIFIGRLGLYEYLNMDMAVKKTFLCLDKTNI